MLTSMQRIIVMSAIAASLSSASLVGQQGINASNTTSPPAYNQDQQCSPRSRIGIIGVSAFVVKEAIKRGPAARAGITPGDIITEINGRQLSDEMSFQGEIWSSFPNTQFELTFLRSSPSTGNQDELKASVRTRKVKNASENMRQPIHPISEIAIIGVYGFVLKAVQPGSAAQQAGLRVGDVITSLNDQALISMEEFQKQIHFSAPGTLFQIKYLRYNTRSGSLEESQTSAASQAIETLQAVFRH